MDRRKKIHIWYFFVAIWGILLLQNLFVQWRSVDQIPYSQFLSYLENDAIEEISITNQHIRGTLKQPPEGARKRFITVRVEPELADQLAGHDLRRHGPPRRLEDQGEELAAFVASVRDEKPPPVDARQGRKVLELAHRVRRAIEPG